MRKAGVVNGVVRPIISPPQKRRSKVAPNASPIESLMQTEKHGDDVFFPGQELMAGAAEKGRVLGPSFYQDETSQQRAPSQTLKGGSHTRSYMSYGTDGSFSGTESTLITTTKVPLHEKIMTDVKQDLILQKAAN